MATAITNDGEEWSSQKVIGNRSSETFDVVAVGTGTTDPSETDTDMESEVYRASTSDSNVSIDATSTDGEIACRITISGGTEVAAGTDITEFGLFVSDGSTLVYRETRSAVTLNSGDRKTFEFTINFENV